MDKILKPVSCSKCPVVKVDKDTIVCGCMKELKAIKTDYYEQDLMYGKCPIGWDKEENK